MNKMNGNDQQSGHCRSLDGWWGLVSGGVAVKIGGYLNWEWPRLSETRSQAQKPAHKDLKPKWPRPSPFADALRNALTGPETST